MPIASSLLNKPRLVKKLKDFYTYVNKNNGKVGTKTRGIDLNFNNACNLRCKYCFTNSPKGDHVKEFLDYKAIAKLADEADELGYFEFDLQGGELLLQPKKLFEVLDENNFYKDKSIVDFNMASSGVNYDKRSFMSVEVTLFKKEPLLPINSDKMIPMVKSISEKIITDVFEKDENFKFFKRKS